MLIVAIKISLCTIIIYEAFQEGMILHWPYKFIHWLKDVIFGKEKAKWILKPITDCLICFSSVWTFIFMPVFKIPLHDIPVIMLLVGGLNTIYVKILCKKATK